MFYGGIGGMRCGPAGPVSAQGLGLVVWGLILFGLAIMGAMVYVGFRTDWQNEAVIETVKLLGCVVGTIGTTGFLLWRAAE